MTVATTSKQSIALFWKSFTKGKATRGRYSTSPKMAAQWANADRTLEQKKKNRTENQQLQKKKSNLWLHGFHIKVCWEKYFIKEKEKKANLCSALCSFWLLMGYFSCNVRKAECRPLSVRLLYAAWFSGRQSNDRQTNILQQWDAKKTSESS